MKQRVSGLVWLALCTLALCQPARAAVGETFVGKPMEAVKAQCTAHGFSWEPQHDNRYIVVEATKGKETYAFEFAVRRDTNRLVCESVSVHPAGRTFAALAPSGWRKYEAYLVYRITQEPQTDSYTESTQVVLILRQPRGEYLRWEYTLDQSRAVRLSEAGSRWKLTVTGDWTKARVTYSNLSLNGVTFRRNYSGGKSGVEVDNPAYGRGERYAAVAVVRWKPGDTRKVVYFARKD